MMNVAYTSEEDDDEMERHTWCMLLFYFHSLSLPDVKGQTHSHDTEQFIWSGGEEIMCIRAVRSPELKASIVGMLMDICRSSFSTSQLQEDLI